MLVERNRSVQEARKDPGKSRQNVFSNLQVRKPSELQTSVCEEVEIAPSLPSPNLLLQ